MIRYPSIRSRKLQFRVCYSAILALLLEVHSTSSLSSSFAWTRSSKKVTARPWGQVDFEMAGTASPGNDNETFETKLEALSSSTDKTNRENDYIEGFGVNEKTMGFRDLVQSVDMSEELAQYKSDDSPQRTILQEEGEFQSQQVVPILQPIRVLRFVAPTLALWIAPPVMSLIDTSVVGRYCGSLELAALNPACTLIDASAFLFFFIATAATNMVASARANDDSSEQQRIIGEALFLSLISGIFLTSIVLVAGQPLLSFIAGAESAAVVPSALKYATVRAFGQPFVVMSSVARAAALAQQDTRGPLLSVALAFVLNAVGTQTLVRYTPLRITGAAIATLGADITATLYLLRRLRKRESEAATDVSDAFSGKSKNQDRPLFVIPTWDNLRRFLQFAAPIFATILGKTVIYNGVAISVGRLGSVALAAHQVLLRSFFFWTPVGDSVGMTSQVFLPSVLAEERRTQTPKPGAKRLLFTIGTVAGLVAAALAGLLPSKGAGLFTTDLEVAAALKQTAPILAISIGMHAVALTCEGMLLAQRDLSYLSTSYVITTILTAVLLLSPWRPSTLGGSWWILAMFQFGRALPFALRTVRISNRWRAQLTTKSV